MPSSQHNNWWRLHVSALLQEFMKSNVRTSIRFKALAVMGVVNSHAGGFGYCTEMSSAEIANEIGVPGSSISNTLKLLDDLNVIRRDPAEGRGGRLVITPLGPEHWRLPNGGRFQTRNTEGGGLREEKSGFIHQKEPGFHKITKESVDLYDINQLPNSQMETNSYRVFMALFDEVVKTNKKKSHEASKLVAVMGVILTHSKGVGNPCPLLMNDIGAILNHSQVTMVRILARLEELGFIKREWEGRKKRITAILPDSAPVDCSDEDKEVSK